MKKLSLSLCLVTYTSLLTQQLPTFSHYFHAKSYLNPALTGVSESLEGFVATKRNWTNSSLQHVTHVLTLCLPLSQQRLGLGLLVMQDEVFLEKRIFAGGNISYKINLCKGYLHFGMSMNFMNSQLDLSKLSVKDRDDSYLTGVSAVNILTANAGLAYQRPTWTVGLAGRSINRPKVNYSKFHKNSYAKRNYTLYAYKKMDLSNDFKLGHLFAAAYTDIYDFYVTYMPYVFYKDDLGLGMGYRSNNILCAAISLRLSKIAQNLNQLSLCYAYAYTLGNLGQALRNTHEIGVKFEYVGPSTVKKIKSRSKEITPLEF